MFRSLSPGAIGASVENLADGLDLAERKGVRLSEWSSPYLRRPLCLKEVRP